MCKHVNTFECEDYIRTGEIRFSEAVCIRATPEKLKKMAGVYKTRFELVELSIAHSVLPFLCGFEVIISEWAEARYES